MVGDADSIRLGHAVDLFGLRGGGKANGGMHGLPSARLAVLPGTTHLDVLGRVELLVPILRSFLDAPMP